MEKKRDNTMGGLVLIGIGLLVLAGNLIDLGDIKLGAYVLPAISILLLLWGIITHEAGPIIPGGIMGGISAGIFLTSSVDGDGGLFMLAFAGGWVLITVLTAVFTNETHWWPLIPGGIMALVGFTALYGGIFASTLAFLGKIWPITLIALGIYVLWQVRKQPKSVE
ncbi:MAG: hypothetical protein H6658_21660 [Ardenticatenaceae bacterium]|nr:hypothetical protein [Ardenticatenaceae bacterium]